MVYLGLGWFIGWIHLQPSKASRHPGLSELPGLFLMCLKLVPALHQVTHQRHINRTSKSLDFS
jgi:hypothetical protein